MAYQHVLKGEGIKGVQKWRVNQRLGYVAVREDENGSLVVLWKDVENMFANSNPKYATIDDSVIPFHFHKNLTEKEPRRISHYPNDRIVIQGRSLDSTYPTEPQFLKHEVQLHPMLYPGLITLVLIILLGVRGSSSSSKSKIEVSPATTADAKRNENWSCHCHRHTSCCQQQQQNQPTANEKPVGNVRACCTTHSCCHHQQHNESVSAGN
ncbi:hypothetical protein F5H01DRAFT_340622 [Linnemannia elongata]|nr:hypothetical protein F5H01DRAFT_340622 [Linnemannia elongata]